MRGGAADGRHERALVRWRRWWRQRVRAERARARLAVQVHHLPGLVDHRAVPVVK